MHVDALQSDLLRRTGQVRPPPRVAVVGHASNAAGTINPVRRIVEMVRTLASEAIVYVEAVQSVPHVPVDVQALGCDLLACSAYK